MFLSAYSFMLVADQLCSEGEKGASYLGIYGSGVTSEECYLETFEKKGLP